MADNKNFINSLVDDLEINGYNYTYIDKFIHLRNGHFRDNIDFNNSKFNLYKSDIVERIIEDRYLLNEDFIGLVKTSKDKTDYISSILDYNSDLFKVFTFYKEVSDNCSYNEFNPEVIINDYNYYNCTKVVIKLNDNMYTEIIDDFKYYKTYIKEDNIDKLLISTVGSDVLNGKFNKYAKSFNYMERLFNQAKIASDLINHYSCNEDIFALFINSIYKFNNLELANFSSNLFSKHIATAKSIYLGNNVEYLKRSINYIKNNSRNNYTTYYYFNMNYSNIINIFKIKDYKLETNDIEVKCYQDILINYIKFAFNLILRYMDRNVDIEYFYNEAKRHCIRFYNVTNIE